ncbi:MAG: response regulator [Eubacteriales bacterium]|nr:response regulator [Eubacteriales bacterium]
MYRVFLADDEMWVLFGLKKLIEKSGLPFQIVGEATNGVTTLEELEKKRPDVLFSDIRMPGLDGLELLERIKERGLQVEVIFVSGYAEFEYARRALQMEAFDYILKPVEQEILNNILLRLMKKLSRGGIEADKTDQKEQKEQEMISPTVVKQMVNEIKEHYTENITLVALAEKYGFSVGYVSSLLKDELGLSFSEYITAKRIQKAKELLADFRLSIDMVAEQSGYNDYFYFTKVFKKVVGISPSKYRKNL